jgi:hypothetical protein
MAKSNLEIVITAVDKASTTIDQVSNSLAGKLGKNVVAGAAIGLGAAAAGMGAVGVAAVSLAKDAAPLQGVQGAFEGITEAAGKSADEMLDALKRGSAGMVTNRDLMTSFNKAAQLVSVDFAEQLPDAMQYLGKVSAATGQDMGFMMDSLVTGIGRMSPMILDNLGIQVQLSEGTERAAEMFGVEADALTKAQEQAGWMNVVLKKLATNTENMPDVAGSAQQAFANWSVTMQNVKDQIGLAVLPAVTRMMQVLGPIFERVIANVMPKIERFADLITQLIGVIMEMGLMSSETEEVLASMFGEDTAATIMGIVEAISNFAESFGNLMNNTIIPFVSEHGVTLLKVLGAIAAGLAAFSIITTVIGWITGLVSIVSGLIATITTAGSVIGGIVAILGGPVTLIIAAVIGLIALFTAAWKNNWFGIRDIVNNVWNNYLKPAFDALVLALKVIWAYIETNVMPIFKVLAEIAGQVLGLAVKALAGLWTEVLLPALTAVWDFLVNKLGPAFKWFKDKIIDPVANALRVGIGGALDWVLEKLKIFKEWLSTITLPEWLIGHSPSPFENSLRGIADALGSVNNALGEGLQPSLQGLSPVPITTSGAIPQTAGTPNITINATINNDADVEDLALRLAEVYRTRMD